MKIPSDQQESNGMKVKPTTGETPVVRWSKLAFVSLGFAGAAAGTVFVWICTGMESNKSPALRYPGIFIGPLWLLAVVVGVWAIIGIREAWTERGEDVRGAWAAWIALGLALFSPLAAIAASLLEKLGR